MKDAKINSNEELIFWIVPIFNHQISFAYREIPSYPSYLAALFHFVPMSPSSSPQHSISLSGCLLVSPLCLSEIELFGEREPLLLFGYANHFVNFVIVDK